MTREELKEHCLKQIENCEMWARLKDEEPHGKVYEEHKLILELLEQEPRWIPTSERLPEERLGVLVWCPTRKNIYCACYEEKQWWIFGAYWEKVTEEIVAWRPLPINPNSEVEE